MRPILILAAHSDTLPLTTVDDYADTVVAQQISQITGVAQVIIGGEQKPAVRVQVDPAKLQARGLTLEDVRSVLAIANTDASKGSINGAQQSFTIAANDQLLKAEDYNDVIIAYRNGAPIRVRDVGQAVAGPAGRQHRGAVRRQAGGHPAGLQAAGRQRHRHRRSDQSRDARPGRRHPARHADRHHRRPHADHPRLGAGRRVHAGC